MLTQYSPLVGILLGMMGNVVLHLRLD